MAPIMPFVVNQIGDAWNAPVKGPGIAFAILFAITGVWHVFQNFKYRAWYMLWLLPCAVIILVAGCICREWSAFHPQDDSMLTAIQGLFYSGAVVITTALYMLLFFLIRAQHELFRFWPRAFWIIWNVLMSAVISLTAQGSASFFNPNASPSSAKSGHILLEVSLIMMLVISISFLALVLEYHRRCSQAKVWDETKKAKMNIVLWTLCGTGLLMLVRDIFRIVQIFSSYHSLAWTSEALFWIFDVVPLLLCLFALNITCPSKLMLE